MDIATIDKRLTSSKPLKYVSIGGIVLAVLSFFFLLFLFFKFLFGLGYHAITSLNFSAKGQATTTSQVAGGGGFFSIPYIQPYSTSTSATGTHITTSRVHANYVYGIPCCRD